MYCIGDLHGRYDLFLMALEKINFNIEKDKMYILGDVIDVNYGAIKILRYIMQYTDSFELVLGNHEQQFKSMELAYDMFMLDNVLKQKVKDVVENFFNAYRDINYLIRIRIKEKNFDSLKDSLKVREWLKPSKKRELLLDSIINLIKYLDYDESKFYEIEKVLNNMIGHFKTKQFVKELLELNTEEYLAIKEYIFSRTLEIKFNYLNRDFWLVHSIPFYNGYPMKHIPDMITRNQYVIFGHDPIVKIHKNFSDKNFKFNYREVFSLIDRFDNHYYNLDMTDNFAAVLRLDDFEEFYVMKYKREPKSKFLKAPTESVYYRKRGYKIVDSAFPINKSKKGFSFITYRDYCMEYLIGVNKFKKKIYYKRISYMYFKQIEVIEDWYEHQSIEEVIKKVIDDDKAKKDTEEVIYKEKFLRGFINALPYSKN